MVSCGDDVTQAKGQVLLYAEYASMVAMKYRRTLIGLVVLCISFSAPALAAETGHWSGDNAPLLKQDINTASKLGQWTETFLNGSWGYGSWVKGHATDASGKLMWKLTGPTIVVSHPSVLSDTDGDGAPDMILTNYQGGSFTLYDVEGLWGEGAVFVCVDTIIEDHFNPFKKTYEYGYVDGIAENKELGLTVYLDARVIETSTAGSSHSGELTEVNFTIVSDPIRQAIEERFDDARIRKIQEDKVLGLSCYRAVFVSRGQRMEAVVSSGGVLGDVESFVTLQDVPKTVAKTIHEELRGQKIARIRRIYCFGSVKSDKWISLDKPSLSFDVQYLVDGKEKSLRIEHEWLKLQTQRNRKQQWARDGKPVQVFCLKEKIQGFVSEKLSADKKN